MSLCQPAREGGGDSSFRASAGVPQALGVTMGWNSLLSGDVHSHR